MYKRELRSVKVKNPQLDRQLRAHQETTLRKNTICYRDQKTTALSM
jgi:hypothetical protein